MIFAKLLFILLAFAAGVPSPKVGIDYEGEIDIYTGEPAYSEEAVSQRALMITDNCYYDTNSRLFRFSVPESSEYVYANVADGMITDRAVTLKPDSSIVVSLYKNGSRVEKTDLSEIAETGSYTLVVSSGAEVEYQLFSFVIASGYTSGISSYKMPGGFEITGIVFSGENQPEWNKDSVDLSKDGEYNISYTCKATGIEYGLKLKIDNTPPKIELEGLKDGIARNPVTISGPESGDRVRLTCDGKEMDFPEDGVVKMPGKYVVTVTDPAGNTVTETFKIQTYLNAQAIWFTVIIIAVIAAAGVYMYMARKKLRVR